MRRQVVMGVVALCLSGAGCSLAHDATCLTAYRLREAMQDHRETARNRQWAESAWQDVRCMNPCAPYSEDHAGGFKDGFAHYLFWGGTGEPPPVPPRRYRTVTYQTPEGYRAIEDWFTGFRHGAAVAQQSGYRQWVTGPSALRGTDAGPTFSDPALPVPAPYVPVPPSPQTHVRRGAGGPYPPVILLPPAHAPEVPPEQLGPPTPLPTRTAKDEG